MGVDGLVSRTVDNNSDECWATVAGPGMHEVAVATLGSWAAHQTLAPPARPPAPPRLQRHNLHALNDVGLLVFRGESAPEQGGGGGGAPGGGVWGRGRGGGGGGRAPAPPPPGGIILETDEGRGGGRRGSSSRHSSVNALLQRRHRRHWHWRGTQPLQRRKLRPWRCNTHMPVLQMLCTLRSSNSQPHH